MSSGLIDMETLFSYIEARRPCKPAPVPTEGGAGLEPTIVQGRQASRQDGTDRRDRSTELSALGMSKGFPAINYHYSMVALYPTLNRGGFGA